MGRFWMILGSLNFRKPPFVEGQYPNFQDSTDGSCRGQWVSCFRRFKDTWLVWWWKLGSWMGKMGKWSPRILDFRIFHIHTFIHIHIYIYIYIYTLKSCFLSSRSDECSFHWPETKIRGDTSSRLFEEVVPVKNHFFSETNWSLNATSLPQLHIACWSDWIRLLCLILKIETYFLWSLWLIWLWTMVMFS